MENKEKWWKTMENDGKRGKTMENDGKWLALTTCLWPPGVQSISLRKWRKTRLVTVGPCSESTHHSKSGKPKIPFRCYGCGISVAMWRKCGENVEQSLGSQQPRHWSRLSSRAKLRHPRIQHGLIGEVSSPFFTIGLPLVSWPMDDFGFRSPTYEAQHFFGVGKLRWKRMHPLLNTKLIPGVFHQTCYRPQTLHPVEIHIWNPQKKLEALSSGKYSVK